MAVLQSNANKLNADGNVEIMIAYEYVLKRLGQDSAAGPLWLEYIKFMADFSPNSNAFRRLFEPEPGKESSKRALRLRDLYQKAMLVCSTAYAEAVSYTHLTLPTILLV